MKKLVFMLAAVGLLWTGTAMAIPVPDASFEGLATAGSWDYVNDVTSPWDCSTGDSSGAWIGDNYANTYGYPQVGHDGTAYVDLNSKYTSQTLSEAYVLGETYTLSVWATTHNYATGERVYLYFTDDNGILADSGANTIPTTTDFTWYEYDLSYTADGSEVGNIGISFWGDWETVIDDVSLVPEPMTLSLLGLGGLALIRRKK